MSLESNRQDISNAYAKLTAAIALLRETLALVSKVAPTGHDAVTSVYDARRATEVAHAKVAILQRRLP